MAAQRGGGALGISLQSISGTVSPISAWLAGFLGCGYTVVCGRMLLIGTIAETAGIEPFQAAHPRLG